ncbi:MAG TPA: fimbria/pilus outer membrane usher protein [Gammaproteobacteria bacterium]|nr:fimbria/pilus outer membrane usher protein [Gammaproteobacteria bacterium]
MTRAARVAGSGLAVPRHLLVRLGISVRGLPVRKHAGQAYVALDAVPHLRWHVDAPRQALMLDVPAGVLRSHRLVAAPVPPAPQVRSTPGGFLNYRFFTRHDHGRRTRTSGLVELGVFDHLGVGLASFVDRDMGHGGGPVRLRTTWRRDFPARMDTLRLGDAITVGGDWGRPVRFGGVQWGTNFATRPGFITFPLPAISGEAALPSNVDVYVNNALRYSSKAPAGPFTIDQLPVITGQGTLRMVVTDILGRQHVVTEPYYASSSLLRPGLSQYSLSLGALRRDFGLASNHYGRRFAMATERYGIRRDLTGEVHTELLRSQQTLGVSAAWRLGHVAVLSGSVAASHAAWGGGHLLAAGLDRHGRNFSIGYRITTTSSGFTRLGARRGFSSPRLVSRAYAGVYLGRAGSLSVGDLRRIDRVLPDTNFFSASYSVNVGHLGSLFLNLFHPVSGPGANAVMLTFSLPLGRRTQASASVQRQGGVGTATAELQRSLPPGPGIGYRLYRQGGDFHRSEAELGLRTNIGTYHAAVANVDGRRSYRGGVSGGVAFLGGHVMLSRRLEQSFALAEVPGFAGVGLYRDNQIVARTNASGLAIVPGLRPYQDNTIGLEQSDLPLRARIRSTEVDRVPAYRSGVIARFAVSRTRSAEFTVQLPDGHPLPVGARVRVRGAGQSFPVGSHGRVYMEGLKARQRILARWHGGRCSFELDYPRTHAPQPDLGVFTCR